MSHEKQTTSTCLPNPATPIFTTSTGTSFRVPDPVHNDLKKMLPRIPFTVRRFLEIQRGRPVWPAGT